MRSLSRLSALPILLAAGTLSCQATPVRADAQGSADARATSGPEKGQLFNYPAALAIPADGSNDDSAADAANFASVQADSSAEPTPRGEGPRPLLWLYALGGCTAVAMAAWFTE